MHVVAQHPFRVTRNADLELEEDEADDLLAAIEPSCGAAGVCRRGSLEVDSGMSDDMLDLLTASWTSP